MVGMLSAGEREINEKGSYPFFSRSHAKKGYDPFS
jgi:hypothetical protein